MKNILNLCYLMLCIFAFALTGCGSTPQYQNPPQAYQQPQQQRQPQNNSDVESEDGQYQQQADSYQQTGQQPQYQQEDHTVRNGLLAAGAGYLAGRVHANYNQKNERKQTNNTVFLNRPKTSTAYTRNFSRSSTRSNSPSRTFSSPTRRYGFGSFGSRSSRRR